MISRSIAVLTRRIALGAGALIAAGAASPLFALSMQECSAAYKDAKTSGSLGGMSWQTFRKAKCGAAASAKMKTGAKAGGPIASPPGTATGPAPGPSPGGSGYLPTGRMVLPSAIPPKYASDLPGKARWRTCLDQYRLNKASNANGGLNWVQKGGGYYSECNRRLQATRRQH